MLKALPVFIQDNYFTNSMYKFIDEHGIPLNGSALLKQVGYLHYFYVEHWFAKFFFKP